MSRLIITVLGPTLTSASITASKLVYLIAPNYSRIAPLIPLNVKL